MLTSRRDLLRYGFETSIGALVPPSFRRARSNGEPLDADMNVTEFLMEWAEMADWRKVGGPNPAPSMHHGIMLSMSRKYVQDYFERHGEVPTGTHRVRYRCGRDPSNDIYISYVDGTSSYDEMFTYLGGGRLSIRVLPK